MAFFKTFQQNLPSVSISSILDSVSSKVDVLANAVSDVTYAVSDQLTEQVNTIINKVQEEEDGEQDWAQTSTTQDGKAASRSLWPETSSNLKNNPSGDAAEADCEQSQLEWEWRDGCWRVKKTAAELDSSGPPLPSAYEPEPLAKYGTLDVAFEYDSNEQWLAVTVTAATDIPALKQAGNISWQVHLVLLPTKKQRAKTGVQKGPCPVFTETFKFSRVEQEVLSDCAVRFRLYSIRRMKKEKVLGEKVFHLTNVSRSAGVVSYRSTEDSSSPEILLGLVYNSATGHLSAEVIQGSHFKSTASDKPVSKSSKEMSKFKTAVCRGQPSPSYKETFVFQVALFQLTDVSLVLSVFCRRSSMRPRERLGWVSLGHSSTGEEELAHWTEMKEAEGQQVCHWHTLTDTKGLIY
uniref:Synaptotagmin XIVb n=1 Tax=Hippocampus comes TaxID=109280 RepID=A0A3Q2YET7_HIPCM